MTSYKQKSSKHRILTREELDKRWADIRHRLDQVTPAAIVASLFVHTGLSDFPLDARILHPALLRLKEYDRRYDQLLEEFTFSFKGPFPFCSELDDAIPRLVMTREISIPNPYYNRIKIKAGMRKSVIQEEKKWFPDSKQRQLIREMGAAFTRFIKEEERGLKKREKQGMAV